MNEQRTILLATDSDAIHDQVAAALGDPGTAVVRVSSGHDVLPKIDEYEPDLVVLDLQIGSMGGVATSLAIRNEVDGGRLDDQNILLLLDRIADVFIAKRSEADGWITKPINPLRLRRAAAAVMGGGNYTEHYTEHGDTPGAGTTRGSARSVVSGRSVATTRD